MIFRLVGGGNLDTERASAYKQFVENSAPDNRRFAGFFHGFTPQTDQPACNRQSLSDFGASILAWDDLAHSLAADVSQSIPDYA